MSRKFYLKKTFILMLFTLKVNSLFAQESKTDFISLDMYDLSIYLIEEFHGIMVAKNAQDNIGKATYGGVTGLSSQLRDFSIPISLKQSYNNNYNPKFTIISALNQDLICSKFSFYISQSQIKLMPTNVKLNTAVNCKFDILNTDNKIVSNFSILINYTFKYWLNEINSMTDSYKTANLISLNFDMQDPSTLTAINLSNRGIVDLSPISGFHNLKVIDVSYNHIKSLPLGVFDNFKSLKWLFLHHNSLHNLSSSIFNNLKYLEMLTLNDNKLNNFPINLFKSLVSLKLIELSNNYLTVFPLDISELKKLISIGLSSNNLYEIPENAFANMKDLTYISLSDNQLKTLPENIFNNLSYLKMVKLENNKLYNLPISALINILGREEYDLSGNPFVKYILNN
ncbi:leucine-rich repeat domain-containing protein [Fluviispira multicolorata]|uniref:Leucine-rich repeat protein n=1 Tax=Fluviispira multicolorata TaxID=2654512 RepID=A0A833JFC7_9BACT|nr:leucine-rich repeat protein [Fluviispira multicolorata]KAB8033664.1 leucine-rich repeat protein [Fluviispira multicolorata]